MASGVNNTIRLYSPTFDTLISEIKTPSPVACASIDIYDKLISVFQINGSIALLDLETQEF
jgi:hypothetical protein